MRIVKIIKKLLSKWGFDQKNDEPQQVDIPYKQRKIVAFILLFVIFLKIGLFVLQILMNNPGFEKIYKENSVINKENYHILNKSFIADIIRLLFEVLFYGVGIYVMLDTRYKLTKKLFEGIIKKTYYLSIIFIITFSISFYGDYKEYNHILEKMNDELSQKGISKVIYLDASFFTVNIISFIFSLLTLVAYYVPFKAMIVKNNIFLNKKN